MASNDPAAPFTFPPVYDFPPFYTRQPTQSTWQDQVRQWSSLILSYCQHHRRFRLNLGDAAKEDLFYNRTINRRLAPETIREAIQYMVDQKQATWETDDKRSAPTQCLVYWHKPEEWAQLIYDWVQDNGLSNSVYTLYELAHDDATKGTAFYDIDYQVLRNALDVLVVRGKAQLFESDASPGNPGVKFF